MLSSNVNFELILTLYNLVWPPSFIAAKSAQNLPHKKFNVHRFNERKEKQLN